MKLKKKKKKASNKLATIVLDSKPEGSRPPGRLPKRWYESFQYLSSDQGLGEDETPNETI